MGTRKSKVGLRVFGWSGREVDTLGDRVGVDTLGTLLPEQVWCIKTREDGGMRTAGTSCGYHSGRPGKCPPFSISLSFLNCFSPNDRVLMGRE